MRHLKLTKKSLIITISSIICVVLLSVVFGLSRVFATKNSDNNSPDEYGFHHVTIYDGNDKLSIKTDAETVGEVLDRANFTIIESDSVEPSLDSRITADNFFINIYRSHPALVVDGIDSRLIMTSSFEPRKIAETAGLTIYDDDEVFLSNNTKFLELGAVSVVEIKRGGGSVLTEVEQIAFEEKSIYDYSLPYGTIEVEQYGEVGEVEHTYHVLEINDEEVSRELIGEKVSKEPVARITRIGARMSLETSASENESIIWSYLISAGFSEYQTAGIMGNLMQEHGFMTSDTSGGLGIAQWTGGRRNNLLSMNDPYNIYTQLEYLMSELTGGYASVYEDILNSMTIEDATRIFQNRFERCGVCREENRISFAYAIYESHKGTR